MSCLSKANLQITVGVGVPAFSGHPFKNDNNNNIKIIGIFEQNEILLFSLPVLRKKEGIKAIIYIFKTKINFCKMELNVEKTTFKFKVISFFINSYSYVK